MPIRRALTLIEVLVVIAIIGVLIGLILPAVEMSRESARRTTCANNMRQLGIAAKLHLDAHQTFPTGGWGPGWMGDPDAGFGTRQPGGWVYNVLPFIEQQSLREQGTRQAQQEKRIAIAAVMATPLESFTCPSRRLPRPYPFQGDRTLKNAIAPEKCAKSDYAVNSKVSYEKSEVIASEVQLRGRGMSNTVFAGEKSVASDHYVDGAAAGDQRAMYLGACDDVGRAPGGNPRQDSGGGSGFGSSHPSGCNFVYCDGSVRYISYDESLE
ncbi:DUF1559 domain-containing protein [Lacipirellula parvula]|uniref:DUF1559 domain-containing protein n=1 Tax=Lacipirellula parvula TaxID=2650471 RepID=A0A5K7XLN0_9BACT|nr:DUF1559 domain-containing protein [Lacipirellula parvula]BBO35576.1 hypothetical protein PLANPX_5188 [Lacipirellula parvula]